MSFQICHLYLWQCKILLIKNSNCFILILITNVRICTSNSRQQKLNSPIKNCKNKIIDKFAFVSLLEIAVWLGSNLSVMNKTLFRKYSSAIRSNAFISHLKSGVITLLETEDCDGRKYFIFLTDTSTRACLNKFAVKKCDTHT